MAQRAKEKGRFERVRVYRTNDWPRAVIISMPTGRCYTVLIDEALGVPSRAFGYLKSAREYVRAAIAKATGAEQ